MTDLILPKTEMGVLIHPILGILVNVALVPVRAVQEGISEGKAVLQERGDMIWYDLI